MAVKTKKRVRDKYSKAIDYFRSHPEEISKAWSDPPLHDHGCLFEFLVEDPKTIPEIPVNPENKYGCPCMVRYGLTWDDEPELDRFDFVAGTNNLTKICKEANLPNMNFWNQKEHEFTKQDGMKIIPYLKEFARIQRLADKELGRSRTC